MVEAERGRSTFVCFERGTIIVVPGPQGTWEFHVIGCLCEGIGARHKTLQLAEECAKRVLAGGAVPR